jgi:type VI secretion system protein ImpK
MERLLSTAFAEFYEELVRIKRAAADGRLAAYLGSVGTAADLAANVSARLRGLLAEQAKRIQDEANQIEQSSYRLARYLMAALADEVLGLTLSWDGAPHWRENLLERALFGRAVAGRDFYQLTDRILDSRGNSPVMEDLAAVALMCLRLGFEGQLCGVEMQGQRDRYRQRLLRFIGRSRFNAQDPKLQPLFAAAYDSVISESEDRRLAPMRRWYLIAAIVAGVYLIASTAVWFGAVWNLARALPYDGVLEIFMRH